MTDDILLRFQGPFSWASQDGVPVVFEHPIAKMRGLYVWTVPTRLGEAIYYVGQTGSSFGLRLFQHLKEHLAGAYHVYDPDKWRDAEKVELWPGLYGSRKTPSDLAAHFEGLSTPIARLTQLYRFHFAATEIDRRLRERAEAAIALHLYEQPGFVGACQDRGIRYRPRRSSEPTILLRLESACPLMGLPEFLEA